MFYNIIDFVTTRQDVAVKLLLKDQYNALKEHLAALCVLDPLIDEEVNSLLKVVDKESIYRLSKEVIKKEVKFLTIYSC